MGMKNIECISKGFTYSTFLYLSYYYERVILVITYTHKCTQAFIYNQFPKNPQNQTKVVLESLMRIEKNVGISKRLIKVPIFV